jgi:AraC-like DNA-binding protein
MRKYGKNNFEMRVIENCDIEVINEREQHWIKELDTYNSGYNRTLSSGTDPKDFSTMIEEFKQGKTITELANQYHTCRKSLAYMLKLEGIDTRLNQTRPPLTKEKYEQAKALYLQGYTMRKIEQELHTCRKHLAKLFEQEGLIVLKGGNAKTHHPYKNSTAS